MLAVCVQMIGVWCLTVWQQLGSPSKMRLVELGPGRGTLMADLLRGTAPFKPFMSGLDIHLVEVSYICIGQQPGAHLLFIWHVALP